jgi:hypothetical protein
MVAHSVINVPITTRWQGTMLLMFVIGAFFAWRGGRGDQRVFARQNMAACTVLVVLTLYVSEVAPNQRHDADAKER